LAAIRSRVFEFWVCEFSVFILDEVVVLFVCHLAVREQIGSERSIRACQRGTVGVASHSRAFVPKVLLQPADQVFGDWDFAWIKIVHRFFLQ
jgi:hypothetical protein